MMPSIEYIISHTLSYDDIYFNMFEGKIACKDISLLAENRAGYELIVADVFNSEQADKKSIRYH